MRITNKPLLITYYTLAVIIALVGYVMVRANMFYGVEVYFIGPTLELFFGMILVGPLTIHKDDGSWFMLINVLLIVSWLMFGGIFLNI